MKYKWSVLLLSLDSWFHRGSLVAVPASDAGTEALLAVLLLRSSLNDQTEHILSRRCCWRLLCTPLRGRSTKGNIKKRWDEAQFLVKTRTPEWRPTLLEDAAS